MSKVQTGSEKMRADATCEALTDKEIAEVAGGALLIGDYFPLGKPWPEFFNVKKQIIVEHVIDQRINVGDMIDVDGLAGGLRR